MESDSKLTQDQDNLLKANLKQLRLDHCNTKEYKAIRRLCFEYRHFFNEKIPLTSTKRSNMKLN